eukprot:754612-Pleurochrysis_carterae.AAC.2
MYASSTVQEPVICARAQASGGVFNVDEVLQACGRNWEGGLWSMRAVFLVASSFGAFAVCALGCSTSHAPL